MAENKIGLEAVLETSDFEQGVKTYDSGVDAMTSANEEMAASTGDVTDALSEVDSAAAESGKSAVELAAQMELVEQAYDAIAGVVGEAIELADLGSQANRAEDRFRSFAGEIGDADELLAAFNRGAGGTVDKLTAMTSAGRLLQMGLVQNNDEMEQVVEMATRLGDQTQSAGDRVADFAALLANQSIPRLDNFGISSGKVRARIAELQAAFPAMSREAAFSQAVFEQGAVSLDILGTRTQDAGMKMDIARANIENMRIEMGQRLLPIVAQVFGVIANLNTNTLALIATLGGGLGALVKFSGGLGGLATKMGASTLQMGALVAAVAGLVIAVEAFQDQMNEMTAAQDSAQEAAASLGDQVNELMADGLTLGEAMAQVGSKVNEATTEFNNATVLGIIPLKNALNAGSEFSNTMAEATSSLQGAIVANTESYGAYIEQVGAYNAGITDSAGKLATLSEAEFNMATIREKGASAASMLADEILKESLAVEDTGAAADRTFPILGRFNENQERGASKAEAMAGAVADVSQAVGSQGGALEALAAKQEQSTRIADLRAASEENQAAVTAMATAALEQKRQADISVAQEELKLQQAVMGASDAMIAQTFIQALDPDAMGLTAYRESVEQIQLAFGLATPESIALARGIEDAAAAANAGELNYNKLDDTLKDLIAGSKDGTLAMDSYASAVEDSASATDDLTQSSGALAGELPAVDEGAQQAAEGMALVTEATNEAESAMAEAAAAAPGHGSAIGAGLRAGMEPQMDGFVASFRDKLQSAMNQLPSSEPKDPSSPLFGLRKRGEAIPRMLGEGVDDGANAAVGAMQDLGSAMGQALASSIGDSTDDLFSAAGVLGGLGGAAGGLLQSRIVDPLQRQLEGLESAGDNAREMLEGLTEEQLGIQRQLTEETGMSIGQLFLQRRTDPSQLTFEQLFMLSRLNELMRERAQISDAILANEEQALEVSRELTAEQERLNRLQQQQENLRFLQQQAELLELIAERGLNAEDILGGLTLGLDADVGAVVDAMSAAMEQIIAQAEEELGIASPSKVFEQIGAETMTGMALGVERLMSLPVAQSAIATQAMVAAPAAIAGATTVDNSRTVGEININGGAAGQPAEMQLVATIRRVIREEMRGV